MLSMLGSIRHRHLWWACLLASLVALTLLLYALYEQQINQLYPCVRCIYQRLAVMGIILGGVVSLMHTRLLLAGLLMVIGAACFGYYHAYIHTLVIKDLIIDSCGFRADFGILGRWDLWLPVLFEAGGDCSDKSWQFLAMSMPEWMKIIFSSYFFGAIFCLIVWIRQLIVQSPDHAMSQ